MKKLMSVVVPLACASFYSYPAYSASFDCNKASTYVEYAICDNPQLSKLDDDLAVQYSAEKADANKLGHEYYIEHPRTTQLNWLLFQRNTCTDEACLIREYQERLGGQYKFGSTVDYTEDDSLNNAKHRNTFGRFKDAKELSTYDSSHDPEGVMFDDINGLDILSVNDRPYLAVVDGQMWFSNGHFCSISNKLAKWSQNHWVLNDTYEGETTELRIYPATHRGKTQIFLKDITGEYRRGGCGSRGSFDGLIFERAR